MTKQRIHPRRLNRLALLLLTTAILAGSASLDLFGADPGGKANELQFGEKTTLSGRIEQIKTYGDDGNAVFPFYLYTDTNVVVKPAVDFDPGNTNEKLDGMEVKMLDGDDSRLERYRGKRVMVRGRISSGLNLYCYGFGLYVGSLEDIEDAGGNRPEPKKAATIRPGNLGEGTVFGVNKPGDAGFNAVTPDFGDRLEMTTYAPGSDSNKDLGLVSGATYSMLMITGKDDQQAFVYWNTPDPRFQDILMGKRSDIASIGNRGFSLQRGDELTIQAQENSEGPGTDVTFSFFRENKPTGTISFIVK